MVNPTGYTALDMIGFTDQGAYSSSDNYVKNDLVHYSGNIWRCLVDDTSGIEPAEGVNWTLFIGEPTNLVERIIAPVETDPATSAWAVGRQIIYNDNLYEVIVAITAGDALVTYEDDPTNANIKLADPVETQLLNVKGNLSNRNLLDNAWFTVNQRGQSSYSGTAGYSYDRWYRQQSGITVSLDSDECVVIQNTDSTYCNFKQPFSAEFIEAINGRTLTLSVLFKDGTIKSATSQNVDLSQNTSYCSITLADGTTANVRSTSISNVSLQIVVKGNTTIPAIRAFKLELGSISTLAMDTAPNYAEELLKCQRYFVRYSATSDCAIGFANATTAAWLLFNLPCAMRTKTPTLTYSGTVKIECAGSTGASGIDITNLEFNVMSQNTIKAFVTVASGLTAGQSCMLHIRDLGKIDISADL